MSDKDTLNEFMSEIDNSVRDVAKLEDSAVYMYKSCYTEDHTVYKLMDKVDNDISAEYMDEDELDAPSEDERGNVKDRYNNVYNDE